MELKFFTHSWSSKSSKKAKNNCKSNIILQNKYNQDGYLKRRIVAKAFNQKLVVVNF